ncbi:MAG: hypothetical protein M1816_000446 [Peltula sp. TS41687]|nr:MAG: hypothetical protein M1816_000446 [Peltula sp. TS41687]
MERHVKPGGPTIIPRGPADNSDQNDQGPKPSGLRDIAKLSGAYFAGLGVAGIGAWTYHRHITDQLLEKHEKTIAEMREEFGGQMKSLEREKVREVNEAYEQGKNDAEKAEERQNQEVEQRANERRRLDADPTELNYGRLVRCFEEQLPRLKKDFSWKTWEQYEDQVWGYCRLLQSIDINDPAFIRGPKRTRGSMQTPGEGSQQNGNGRSTTPRQKEKEPGGPHISPFSSVKSGIMNKVETLGQNFARIAGAAANSVNDGRPSTGFLGGVKAQAPAFRLPGPVMVSPL